MYSVSEIVEGFRRLSAEEQTRAFVEIEKIWKPLQQDGEQSNTDTRPLLE